MFAGAYTRMQNKSTDDHTYGLRGKTIRLRRLLSFLCVAASVSFLSACVTAGGMTEPTPASYAALNLGRMEPPPEDKPPISVICTLKEGQALIGRTWSGFEPVTFRLQQGLQTDVPLRRGGFFADESLVLHSRFEDSGQKIVFCPDLAKPDGTRIACGTLYALEDDYALGLKRTFDIPDAVMSGEILCRQK